MQQNNSYNCIGDYEYILSMQCYQANDALAGGACPHLLKEHTDGVQM
jgi:hypothetical protein